MNGFYRAFLLLSFFLIGKSGFSQTQPEPLLNGNFVGEPFSQFVKTVEAATPYRFFYNPADVDSFAITMRVTNQTLPALLRQLLTGTRLSYSIDARRRVFVTANSAVRTELPVGFFERGITDDGNDSTYFAYLTEIQAKKKEAETKLYEIGRRINPIPPGRATLAGYVRNGASGEPIPGAAVYINNPRIGTVTDQFGYYALSLPRGRQEVILRSVGLKDTRRRIVLYSDGKLDVEMEDDVIQLKEVIVEAEKDVNVSGLQMGQQRIDIKTMKQIPTALGETDLLRVVLTLPGVKSVGESSTGLNVRGGATDQNLILYNDAPIYNTSHLFGFFSAFNPDVIKSAELYKSGIPARYGGRLSSVLEVLTRDGNKKQLAGSGGIGPLTGRLTLEGPLVKDRTSFILGGRTTYSDWILKQLPNSAYKNSQASFYDLNLHITHDYNERNTLYLTGYLSSDRFRLGSDTTYGYRNLAATLKWKHNFNAKLYSVFTGGLSQYNYQVRSDKNPTSAYQLDFSIQQSNLKADFSYFPSAKHTVDFGVSSTLYRLSPGTLKPVRSESLLAPNSVETEQGLESALYLGDRFDVSDRFSVSLGLRYSLYSYLGPKAVIQYAAGFPITTNSITDTVAYAANKAIQTYHGPEYRFSARYSLSDNASVKVSFNRMRQYIQMLSNTTAISPTDIWKLSDAYVKPQVGDQYSVGYYKNLKSNTIEVSVEAYYKTMQNMLDYRSGAVLLLNHHIETDIVNAEGRAYGIELMVKKMTGKLNGWVSYTYARTLLRAQGASAIETINGGKYYPSNYDKPHDVTLIGNYRFNRRISASLNFTYSTGRPITLPIAKYVLNGTQRVLYSERNQYRIPDYYRTDLAVNIEGNHKVKKLAHSSWTVAVYNLLGRHNAYSVYFASNQGFVNGYKLSIFANPIPSVTYNFRF